MFVVVAADGDIQDGAGADAGAAAAAAEAEGWLWQPTRAREWRAYFEELLGERGAKAAESGAWLALSLGGRSCGSAFG